MLKRLLALGLLLMCGDPARAAVLVLLDHISGNDWVYNVRLQPSAFMSVGDTATIYDFPGLQDLSDATFVKDSAPELAGNTFDLSVAPTGPVPAGTNPTDLSEINNVTLTLTGGGVIGATATRVTQLGQLTLTGPSGVRGEDVNFTGLSTQKAGVTEYANIGFLPAPVPEPGTVAFLGIGLGAVAALAFRRRKQSN